MLNRLVFPSAQIEPFSTLTLRINLFQLQIAEQSLSLKTANSNIAEYESLSSTIYLGCHWTVSEARDGTIRVQLPEIVSGHKFDSKKWSLFSRLILTFCKNQVHFEIEAQKGKMKNIDLLKNEGLNWPYWKMKLQLHWTKRRRESHTDGLWTIKLVTDQSDA